MSRHAIPAYNRLSSLDSLREDAIVNVYDSNGHKLGQVNEYGTASDNYGHKVGDVSEDGTVIDGFGRKVGDVSEDGTVTDSIDRKIGNVSMSMSDNICLA